MIVQVDANDGVVLNNVCVKDNCCSRRVAYRRKRSNHDSIRQYFHSDYNFNIECSNMATYRRITTVGTAIAISVLLTVYCLSAVSSFNMPATVTSSGIRQRLSVFNFHETNHFVSRSIQSKSIQHSALTLKLQVGESSGKEIGNVNGASTSSSTTTSTPVPGIVSVGNTGSGQAQSFSVTLDDGTQHSYKDAIQRTIIWVTAALFFGSALWVGIDAKTGEEFFAGYLVEQSLSVDNLFVFLLLFEYFQIPLQYQDRILNWGIYGAIVMRVIMIGVGVAALEHFRGILLVFAAILVYGSAKFFINAGNDDDEEDDPNDNAIIQFAQRFVKSTNEFDGDRFFTMIDGVRTATPLFICMVALELSDVVFAIDSIPAVFGVTENPFIIITSNLFAIMGLRSLYTILSKAAADLKYLEPAVAVVLGFIGSKMIAEYFGYDLATNISLIVVATLLGGGVGASILEKKYSSTTPITSSSSTVPTGVPTTLPNTEAGADTR